MSKETLTAEIQAIAKKVEAQFGYGGRITDTRKLDNGQVQVTVRHKTLEGPERLTTVLCDASGTEIERTTK